MARELRSNIVNFLVLACLPIAILLHAYWLPTSISVPAITDAGYLSIITLTFITCVFVSLLTLIFNSSFNTSKLAASAAAYVVFIYFLREADIHRLLTVEHVTRGKFYTMPDVPLWQKVVAAAVFILLTICLLYLLIKFIARIWNNVCKFEPWAVAFGLWFAILVISQLCDRSGLNHTHVGRVIEESCECWAAIFMFLTLLQLIPTLSLRNIVTTQEKYLQNSEPLNPHQSRG